MSNYAIKAFDNQFLAHCNSLGVQLINRTTATVHEGGQLKKQGGRKYWLLSLPTDIDVATIGIDKEQASKSDGQRIYAKDGKPFTIRYMEPTTLGSNKMSACYQIHPANCVIDLEESIEDAVQANNALATTGPQLSSEMATLLAQARAMGKL